MQTVLVTGAAGDVARQLRPYLRAAYPSLVLSDRTPVTDLAPGERFVAADLTDMAATLAACEGVDGIVHLGGYSVEAPWETIHPANVVGCYNLFEAARQAGVRRVVFASSNHAIGFYERRRRIGVDHRVRPDGFYGVSKAFGEALGSLYADKYGLGVLSIRIGNVGSRPLDLRRLSIWLHPEDLAQLCRIGLEHPELHNEVVYGASDNARGWWDNEPAFRLGYAPRHRAEDDAAHALAEQAKLEPDPIGDRFQGGGFCNR
ncbi:MAG: NAD(P)-dependent oxidoreductase [Geminicoccaceae bacterium]|nr:MAG: NAD(P)-dependent oxidoreductase [Geminicoccaceae bacterium]